MTHSAFEFIRSQTIDALKIRVEEYRHKKNRRATHSFSCR